MSAKENSQSKMDRETANEILVEDGLKENLQPYGRAELTPSVRVLLWAMRLYVLLSFGAVAAQIYVALNAPH